jgi:hypothetical protein
VHRAKGPLTVKKMAEGVVAQKFPTNSQNIPRMVQTRVQELVSKGVFKRLTDTPGVVLAGSNRDQNSQAAKVANTKRTSKKNVMPSQKAFPVERNGGQQLSLRSLLTELLAKSQRRLTGRELAEQALAKGYTTTSKNFLDVIRVSLGKMDNVDNIPGKGYRLKKR